MYMQNRGYRKLQFRTFNAPVFQDTAVVVRNDDNDYDSAFLEQVDTGEHFMVGFKAKTMAVNQYTGLIREQEPVGWAFFSYKNIDAILGRLRKLKADIKKEDLQEVMREVFYSWEAKKVHRATPLVPHNQLSIIPAMNADVINKYTVDFMGTKERQLFYEQYRLNHKGLETVAAPTWPTHRKETENFWWN